MFRRVLCALGIVSIAATATPALAVEPDAPARLINLGDVVATAIRSQLKTLPAKTDHEKWAKKALKAYYGAQGGRILWIDGATKGWNRQAELAMAEIGEAGDYGLNAADFKLPDMHALAVSEGNELARLAKAEIALSRVVLKYALYAKGGRFDPRKISKYLDRGPTMPDGRAVLAGFSKASRADSYLRGLHPKHPQFERLRRRLVALRGKAGEKKVHIRIPPGPTLKPGMRHPQVAILRKRLDVPALRAVDDRKNAAYLYDDAVKAALMKFQKARGLTADGVLGPRTRRVLNKKPVDRVNTILVNMERLRWLPDDWGKTYVWVNIPEFKFRVVKDNTVIHQERIVVGKVTNKTPVFSDEMEFIVFNPYWNVPASIKIKEILPGLMRGSGVLARQGLRVKYRGKEIDPYSVDWGSVDVRRFHIYQPPGARNALGVVKFMFPNKHIVYMHDTPSKSLFNRRVRAYSHGCMRVRNPRKFAEVILGMDKGWTRKKIDGIIARGKNYPVKLAHKIPVHITYFTAWINDDGKLLLRDDVYKHDKKILLGMQGKIHLIAKERKSPKYVPGGTGAPRRVARRRTFWAERLFGID